MTGNKNIQRILFLISLAGPAEGVGSVISKVREKYDCIVIGLRNDNELFSKAGGSWEVLSKQFKNTYDFSKLITSHNNLEGILEKFSPEIVILGSVPNLDGMRDFPEKHIIGIAQKRSIPTVQFVDAWGAWSPHSSCPDYFFVIDEISKQIGKKLFEKQRNFQIKIVGHPGLEMFYSRCKTLEKYKGNNISVYYFTQINVDTEEVLS